MVAYPLSMRTERAPDELRPIAVTTGVNRWAEGSARVEWGHTHVQATVTIGDGLPRHLRGQNAREGWLTAEYALLPRSTHERTQRERLYASGRTQEIQRLLGRAFRSIVDLAKFRNKTVIVDVDVLQADGGTRCAGVLAGYAALHQAASRLVFDGTFDEWPLTEEIAAVSVGTIDGATYVDLTYEEDVAADVDLNVVATRSGKIVEVQGGAEGRPIDAEVYVRLVGAGVRAVEETLGRVRGSLG